MIYNSISLLLLIFLFLIFQVNGKVSNSNKFWPLYSDEDILCITCESICEITSKIIVSQLANKEEHKKGTLELIISEIIDSKNTCTFENFKTYAENFDYQAYKMINFCNNVFEDYEENLHENLLKNYENSIELASLFCIPKYCERPLLNSNKLFINESKEEKKIRYAVEFSEWNKKQENVVTLPSGLQYTILHSNSKGLSPNSSDKVQVHYEGKKLNGEIFDSSYKRNQSTIFPVNGVIKGFSEGLQIMKEGDHFQLFIPPYLGYDKMGAGKIIEPNEFLIFDIKLLKVLKDQEL